MDATLPRPALTASAAGLALGAIYVASPLTVWCVIAGLVICWFGGRGLPDGERRALLIVLGIALAVRGIAVAALFLKSDPSQLGSFPWDFDGIHLKARSLWLRNYAAGVPITPNMLGQAVQQDYGWSSYIYLLAFLQWLAGPAPYAIHLLNVVLTLATATALFRITHRAFGAAPAFIGLGLFLFLPTMIAWSVSALRESLFMALGVAIIGGFVMAWRGSSPAVRIAGAVLLLGTVLIIDSVRDGGRAMFVAGVLGGCACVLLVRRPLLLSLVPLVVAAGILAPRYSPAVQTRLRAVIVEAAVRHIGHVYTEGHSYRALDPRLYFTPSQQREVLATMTTPEAERFVLRSLGAIALEPLPWHAQSLSELAFLPQQLIVYAILLFAPIGLHAGLRRDPLVTGVLAACAGVALAGIAINSGNIGTMVRHRDLALTFLLWLSAAGMATTVGWMMRRVHAAA